MPIDPAHVWDGVPAEVPTLLTIDLDAIVANWRHLHSLAAPGVEVAAVVKADGYGLGAEPVAQALAAAGCRRFFVAHLDEAIRLRPHLAHGDIAVLNGLLPGTGRLMLAERLIPVLNSREQVREWLDLAAELGGTPAAILQVDTGMNRLGLPLADFAALIAQPEVQTYPWRAVISHLACADEPDHPLNALQRDRFLQVRAALPGVPAALAASSGIFLGPDYHADFLRPGVALYGVNPCPGQPNPMQQVVHLSARILQCRSIDSGETVGYGAAHRSKGPAVIATVAVGYADGFLRSAGGMGAAYHGAIALPIVGRISMDLITLDATSLPEALRHAGTPVDLIGPHRTVDDVAADAKTIGYEILTALGSRYHRRHLGLPAMHPTYPWHGTGA